MSKFPPLQGWLYTLPPSNNNASGNDLVGKTLTMKKELDSVEYESTCTQTTSHDCNYDCFSMTDNMVISDDPQTNSSVVAQNDNMYFPQNNNYHLDTFEKEEIISNLNAQIARLLIEVDVLRRRNDVVCSEREDELKKLEEEHSRKDKLLQKQGREIAKLKQSLCKSRKFSDSLEKDLAVIREQMKTKTRASQEKEQKIEVLRGKLRETFFERDRLYHQLRQLQFRSETVGSDDVPLNAACTNHCKFSDVSSSRTTEEKESVSKTDLEEGQIESTETSLLRELVATREKMASMELNMDTQISSILSSKIGLALEQKDELIEKKNAENQALLEILDSKSKELMDARNNIKRLDNALCVGSEDSFDITKTDEVRTNTRMPSKASITEVRHNDSIHT